MYLCREFIRGIILRGLNVPSFCRKNMRKKVEDLVEKALEKHSSLFLIDLKISTDNQIQVIIDGDEGVRVEDCVSMSREIEHHLDREEQDFSLTVMSAGLSEPLILPRQYRKNVGRTIKITTLEGKQFKGELVDATESECKISWSSREKKPVGKGKITVQKEAVIPYKDIKEAKMMITF